MRIFTQSYYTNRMKTQYRYTRKIYCITCESPNVKFKREFDYHLIYYSYLTTALDLLQIEI